MFKIRPVTTRDKSYWFTLDNHMHEDEFTRKVRDKRGYIISNDGKPVGILRYNLFLDSIPYLTLIYIEDAHHKKGLGRQAMSAWEREMREWGHQMVMTSTNVDEAAQHFYRKLGYVDRGGLFLDGTPMAQAQELLLVKVF
ncbi:MAG: GNAT family N-acetyltransferase [Oscillospiraceae bacterium]|nr:GNAT family N-acetyltransferase [Oscillospiraceae bacterium]